MGLVADAFVLLDCPDKVIVERVCGRRTDPDTGKIYHLKFKPPPADIAGRLQHRSDDTEEKVQTRLAEFHANVDAVKGAFASKTVTVDGNRAPAAVTEDCITALTKLHFQKIQTINVVIAGAPGAGKGTQCEVLIDQVSLVSLFLLSVSLSALN